jgi:basic membrane protein A
LNLRLAAAAALTAGLIGLATSSTVSATTHVHAAVDPWGWPGNAKTGWLPPGEPAVHKGRPVVLGLITAGDVTDHGYYESEVVTIDSFVKKYHWAKPIIDSLVNPANALQAAESMCQQHVDLLMIGQSELAAAGPAASAAVCKGTPVWVYASAGTMPPSPYYYLAEDQSDPQSYVTGVAMGLWLKQHNETRAGFIAGPALSFTERPAQAYLAGMQSVVPNASLDAVYTGDFNASGPAITAAQGMLTAGIQLIFPYLGGALFPAAQYIVAHGGATISDGLNSCSAQGVNFAIRQVYDPGYYLVYALQQFAAGQMRVGVTKQFNFGLTPIPTVQFCRTGGVQSNKTLNTLMSEIGAGKLNVTPIIDKTPQPS